MLPYAANVPKQRLTEFIAPLLIAAALMTVILGGSAEQVLGATTTTTFADIADAYVNQNKATTNFGTAVKLQVRASPIERSYIKFNVQGVSGTIVKATLRLTASSSSSVGFDVRGVADNSWAETGITYNNSPPPAATVTASSGSFSNGGLINIDVTPLVKANGSLSVALTPNGTTGLSVSSREAGASVTPRLLVDTAADTIPTNTSPPTISGSPVDGQTLTASPGTWTGGNLTFTHQWRRCDSSTCANIAGATASSYTLTGADIGSTLVVVVTASNLAGTASATSASTATVVAAPPVNTALPTISGSAVDGQTLAASNGTWSGTTPISYAYQWRRCDSGGAGCADVAGATSSSYGVTAADVGSTLRVAVTAANVGGSSTAVSNAALVAAVRPANTSLPTISGTPQDGQTLTAAVGTWSGTPPLSYAYQWRRCDAGGNACANISAATSASYTATGLDVGSTIRVIVTAANAGGSSSAVSAATTVVGGDPPVNTSPPTISGVAQDGQVLTAGPETWTGSLPITYAYQWRRCDSVGSSCVDIVPAATQSYTLSPSDVGATLVVVVTASNPAGTASADP